MQTKEGTEIEIRLWRTAHSKRLEPKAGLGPVTDWHAIQSKKGSQEENFREGTVSLYSEERPLAVRKS